MDQMQGANNFLHLPAAFRKKAAMTFVQGASDLPAALRKRHPALADQEAPPLPPDAPPLPPSPPPQLPRDPDEVQADTKLPASSHGEAAMGAGGSEAVASKKNRSRSRSRSPRNRRSRSQRQDRGFRSRSRSRERNRRSLSRQRNRRDRSRSRSRGRFQGSRGRSGSRQRARSRSNRRPQSDLTASRREKSRSKPREQQPQMSLADAIEAAAAEQRRKRQEKLEWRRPTLLSRMPHVDSKLYKILKLQAIQIRALIGRGGETMRDIRKKTGCDIKVHHAPTDPQGSISIVGNTELCVQLVEEILANKGCPLAPQDSQEDEAEEIPIEAHLVGLFLGAGGNNLRELQNSIGGGVCVSVRPPEKVGGPQRIRIVGPNRAKARVVMQEKVEELSSGTYSLDKPTKGDGKGKRGSTSDAMIPDGFSELQGVAYGQNSNSW